MKFVKWLYEKDERLEVKLLQYLVIPSFILLGLIATISTFLN